ncbi:MAG: hypothetical protein QOF58_3969 [Pseudonocardiales bacterium]|jgi:hypothetical protein|nr:hypothetical protein [Pseudonocardiales bacterium]
MKRELGLLALLLGCAGCGGTVVATDPVLTPETPIGSVRVELVPRTAPTSLPPKSCTPDPATVRAMPAPLIPRAPRDPLSPEGNVAGNELATKIRPELERVCASGDFSLDTTRKALAGYDARVFRADETVTGVAFVITVPQACVLGELRPGNVRISVAGTTKGARCE